MSLTARRALRVDDPLAGREPPLDQPVVSAPTDELHSTVGGWLREIDLDLVDANPSQPRRRFDPEALRALAESIRVRGVLQPVIVRPIGDRFQLVAGERRWRAAKLAGHAVIPALVDSDLDDAGALELALIENIAREDLTAIEQARTLAVLLDDLGVTGIVLAKRLARSRSDIVNTVRLLELPDAVIDLIDTGVLSKGHGKALLSEADHHRRRQLARQAVAAGWSVRALEAQIARSPNAVVRSEPPADQVAAAGRLQEVISRAIGCEARATVHAQGFRITLDQAAAEQLLRLLSRTEGMA